MSAGSRGPAAMVIVALSDQHGYLPDVPPCDVLLVAGDNCPDVFHGVPARVDARGQVQWFMDTWMPWRRKQPAKMCYLTWGNHCYCGQSMSKLAHTALDTTTVAIVDGLVEVGGLKIWMTPWSSQFQDWAFMQSEERLKDLYNPIPFGLDILVSHQPMRGVCDTNDLKEHLGSRELLIAVKKKRPRVLVCGHIHGGHGHDTFHHTDVKFNGG